MNECLKSLVDAGFDAEASVKDVIAKNYPALVGDVVKDATDVGSVESHLATLKTEAQQLVTNPSADADLLAYVTQKCAGDASKAAKIIPVAAKLALDVVGDAEALIKAIKE